MPISRYTRQRRYWNEKKDVAGGTCSSFNGRNAGLRRVVPTTTTTSLILHNSKPLNTRSYTFCSYDLLPCYF
ncbi:hypothetical protein HZ326_10785 [Fusarium oxysporum f. sp. albedinis]|nr:hypothetical protein HZ326_10785 [Fusarium oxysporum f. sp. albedinis]